MPGLTRAADWKTTARRKERALYHDRKSYYWAFVSGKSGDEAALYAVRRGVAVDGVTGEVEDTLPAGAAPGTE